MRLRQQQDVPNLCPCAIRVLLQGWADRRPPVECHDEDHGAFFDLYIPGGIERLWREHESYLRAVAKQWGWEPDVEAPGGRRMFVGEAVAVGLLTE